MLILVLSSGANDRGTPMMPTQISVAKPTLTHATWCLAMLSASWVSSPVSAQQDDSQFTPLFDGKTLDGWEGSSEFFRVESGAIVAGMLDRDIPRNEFLCTKKTYGDFELRVEVMLKGNGDNAGIQFRSKRIPNDHEVSGYQCDVGTAWDRPIWGALYDESRRRKMLAEAPAEKLKSWVRPDDWNELRVVARKKHIQIFLNGQETVSYTEEDKNIADSGIIGLQIHSGKPSEAWYRNIRIREL